jgi:hypothetical protein
VRNKTSVTELEKFFATHPWLWGVTARWFPGTDHVIEQPMTALLLKGLVYSKVTDRNGSSWHVYQRLKDGRRQVEPVGSYKTRSGMPMISVLRPYPGVAFLVELKWIKSRKRIYRQFTIFEIPQNAHGSGLKSLCVKALEVRDCGLDEAKRVAQARSDAIR